MTTEYAEALVKMYLDSLEAEPWDEENSLDLLARLKKESPERFQQLVKETDFEETMNRLTLPES